MTNPAEAETISAAGGTAQHFLQAQPSFPCPFAEGERVIASHGEFLYKAKVVKVKSEDGWLFYVHYMGWKKSWDEWVKVDRLMKYTDENLQKVSQTAEGVKAGYLYPSKFGAFDAGGKKHKKDSALLCRKRKRKHNMLKGKFNESEEKIINISVPLTLKKQLIADFVFIKQTGKLVKLPRTPNVNDITEKYLDYRRKKDLVMSTSLGEILSGLCAYFNKALPMMLLYNNERQQYQEAINENTSPSRVYGAEHLLRLFVKLPALLYDLNIEEETLRNLLGNIHDFLKCIKVCFSYLRMMFLNIHREAQI
ncbi:protein MRG1 isoform X2 [Spinacia oleracea]|uniref:Protein MRG1 isoform X2 n=1 Tax=Spinacia oleracea TaxID=3562 RepID=A0A9R0INP2_SPIOL|nr:protein MRG1-like isoform X2 [Spinacia oleracea]